LSYYGGNGVYISQTEVQKEKATFTVDCYVDRGNRETGIDVSISLYDADNNLVLFDRQSVKDSLTGPVHFVCTVDNPHLWNGRKDPYLYTVIAEVSVGKHVVDIRKIPTGFRFFHVDDKAFYLNGELVRLNGVSRHQDRWIIGNALTKEMHEEDMAFIKELGANSIRLAHYQHNQYFYDLCDKEGMIVWAEIPYITRPSKTDYTGSNPKSQLQELIVQNYNHSSIVMWGVQNEVTAVGKKDNVENIVTQLHEQAKKLDPYRLTTQAQVAMHSIKDSMNEITDVVGFNLYFGWYSGVVEDFAGWLDNYRKANPNRPLCLSEYGVEGIVKYHTDTPTIKDYTEEYHALWHEKAYGILSNTDFVWGTYVWNMFTFAADFRDEGGVKGLNNKGLVNFDRTIRKDAFFYYKAKWNTEPMVHITSKRFHERHHKTITLKAYSNQDDVTFYLNGEVVEHVVKDDVIFTATVTLQEGLNTVKACSHGLCDETTFVTVEKANDSYHVPHADKDKGVFTINADNWIDAEVVSEDELIVDKAFYSVFDPIGDLLKHAETERIFERYFSEFRKHPMFEMASSMSLKMIHDFDRKSMPMALLVRVNKELQKYGK